MYHAIARVLASGLLRRRCFHRLKPDRYARRGADCRRVEPICYSSARRSHGPRCAAPSDAMVHAACEQSDATGRARRLHGSGGPARRSRGGRTQSSPRSSARGHGSQRRGPGSRPRGRVARILETPCGQPRVLPLTLADGRRVRHHDAHHELSGPRAFPGWPSATWNRERAVTMAMATRRGGVLAF